MSCGTATGAHCGRPSVGVLDVVADIAEEVADHLARGEAPGFSVALEPVAIAPGGDGLKREAEQRLEDREVRTAGRGPGILVDVDEHVRGDVPGLRGAVIVGLQRVTAKLGDGSGAVPGRTTVE